MSTKDKIEEGLVIILVAIVLFMAMMIGSHIDVKRGLLPKDYDPLVFQWVEEKEEEKENDN